MELIIVELDNDETVTWIAKSEKEVVDMARLHYDFDYFTLNFLEAIEFYGAESEIPASELEIIKSSGSVVVVMNELYSESYPIDNAPSELDAAVTAIGVHKEAINAISLESARMQTKNSVDEYRTTKVLDAIKAHLARLDQEAFVVAH